MSFVRRVIYRDSPTLAERLGYSDKDTLVIVNIDDVGVHRDETEASFVALSRGVVKSGSVMVPCPNFDRAVTRWKETPEIDLGVHLTLTCEWGMKYPWTPILSRAEVPSLHNREGIMWSSVKELLEHARRKEIRMEWEAQISRMLEVGMKPSHLDHHMDVYYHPELFAEAMELSREYNLPMRVWNRRRYRFPLLRNNLASLRRMGYVFPDTQMGLYNTGCRNPAGEFLKARYYDHLRSLRPGVHNIKIHIARQSEELRSIMGERPSSVRQVDYDVWSSDETKRLGEELGIRFIGFRPLQELQGKVMKRL